MDSIPTLPSLTSSYVHGTSSTSLLYSTIGRCLQRTVERCPDREAVAFFESGVRKTFANFQQDVDQAAAGLLALGLKIGDRLGMWGPNTYEWILIQFAAAKAGIILVSLNPAYQAHEAEYALRKVGCKAVVCPMEFKTQRYCDMLRRICPEIDSSNPGNLRSARLPDLRLVIVLDGRQTGMFHLEDMMQAGSSQHMQQLEGVQKKLSSDDPINIQFTSGTTGSPKAATLSHFNQINNAHIFGNRAEFNWKTDTRVCVPLPLFHAFGTVIAGVLMGVHGVSLVFPSTGYNGTANLAAVERERCCVIYGTPTMYIDMITHPDFAKYDLSSVRTAVIGGSPCPLQLAKEIESSMQAQVMIAYGTTENSPVTFMPHPRDTTERRTENCGYIMDHTEAKVVNPQTGEVLPLGQMGEIMIRGYCVMLDYWGDRAKTEECKTSSGWYKTGDMGTLDAYGYLQIKGRIKDMIIRGGENIYPMEIEQFLHKHPKVKEAQVVGVNDRRMGEEVCACIKLLDGEECTEREIRAYCKGEIAHFKIPRYILFVTSYPLTAIGKVQKFQLRKQVEKQLGLEEAQ